MTKRELLQQYSALCDTHGIFRLDGIGENSRKDEIQNAIDCLSCPEETLNDYLTVIKLKYPNIHRTVTNNGDWTRHPHNRLYVYNTARLALR